MPRHALAAALLAALLLPACGSVETPEHRAARKEARRDACVATELLIHSHDRARSLGEYASDGPLAGVLRASAAFAAAYDQYAQARSAQLAFQDSALTAGSAADSARYASQAALAKDPPAMPGTVQATARERWADDFAASKANPDHPCNKPDDGDESKR
ncbi:MAG: hypothetical protein JWM27_773 [Gemmatimonadetes bacterium]|nr:hypothetical protein [Gemmatimonadota bacterium]